MNKSILKFTGITTKSVTSIALSAMLLVFGCRDEEERIIESGIQLAIAIDQPGEAGGRTVSAEAPDAVMATIVDSKGALIVDHKIFELYQFGETYLSIPITLPVSAGPYRVTEFFVLASNEVKYVTPREGSEMAHLVTDPLDREFSVSKDQITTVALEVIPVDNTLPQDHGYGQFAFDVINTIRVIFSSFIKGVSNFELTESHLKIEALSENASAPLWQYETELEAKANILTIRQAPRYRVTVTKSGYAEWSEEMVLREGEAKEIVLDRSDLEFDIAWNKNFGGSQGDYSGEVIPTADGGLIMIGSTSSTDHDILSPLGGTDVWVMKLNSFGGIEWSKNYGSSADDRSGRPLVEFADGSGYLISGYTYGYDANDVMIDQGWLTKIDNMGNVVWEKSTGKNDYHTGIAVGSGSNDIVLAGHPSTLIRIDGNGNTIWEKTVSLYLGNKAGIANVGDGFVLTGRFHNNIHDNFVKFSWNGESQWETTPFEPLGPYAGAFITSVLDDGYLVFGSDQETSSSSDLYKNADPFISKISPTGQLIWKRKIESTPDRKEYVYDAVRTSEGNYLVVGMVSKTGGYYTQAAWMSEVTAEGKLLKEKTLEGTSSLRAPGRSLFMRIAKQGGHYILAGITDQLGGSIPGNYGGYSDIWAMKIGF